MKDRFSWIINEKLAGMPKPGRIESLAEDCQFLKQKGIDLLVSLTEECLDVNMLKKSGITSMHLPIRDFHAPSIEQLTQFVNTAQVSIKNGKRVGVHCHAGLGRTGTFLAAYLINMGMAVDDAMTQIRRQRPGSIETSEQEDILMAFRESLF